MTGNIILGVVLGLPLVLGLLFRVNASYLFFSILAGEVLARYFGDDAELAIRTINRGDAVMAYAELAVLVIPVLLTVLFLRNSLSKGKVVFHIIPYAVMGVVFAAFVLPLLPNEVKAQVESTQYGKQLLQGSDAIIGAIVFLQLVTLWLTNRPGKERGKKKHA
jgi:hypothetical protein